MSETMMALGGYRFSLTSAAYQELRRSNAYRWQAQERLQRLPAQQFVGPGSETLDLKCTIYPHYRGGMKQLDVMRAQAGRGVPLLLVDGLGFIWSQWVILQFDETQTVMLTNGQPRKLEFQLRLARYGEDS
jgi:phage protein U